MEKDINVNGFIERINISDKDISDVYFPLLKSFTAEQKRSQKRLLVFLAAPPGSGKSTLVNLLQNLSETESDIEPIQALGIDGFHYYQTYLDAKEIERDGVMVSLASIKGAPETFDVGKLTQRIEALKKDSIYWPEYSRVIHDPIEDKVFVFRKIILLEGNYLLLNKEPWKRISSYCDSSIFLNLDESVLEERLIERKIKGGLSREEAENWYKNTDSKNVELVMNNLISPNRTIFLDKNNHIRRYIEDTKG